MAERDRQGKFATAEEAAKARYPSSPSMWKSLVPAQELSTDPKRRAMQLQYPNSECMWPPERNLDDEYNKLEAHLADTARKYPNSVLEMCAPQIHAALNQATAAIEALDAEAAAAASTATTGE